METKLPGRKLQAGPHDTEIHLVRTRTAPLR